MEVAPLLDKHFPTHGDGQGLSIGQVVVTWLSHILSAGGHRLNPMQVWVESLSIILKVCLGAPGLRELDFTDDRLCLLLDHLGRGDAAWETYEREQNAALLRVYDLDVLCPLPAAQMSEAALNALLAPVWRDAESPDPVYRAPETDAMVVQSLKRAAAQQTALDQRLKKAEQEVSTLNPRGRDRNRLNEEQARARGFSRYRGKIPGLAPLFFSSAIRIKGLIRLLSIGLRVLCLVEFTVRDALQERSEKLDGIYAGNPKQATDRPTTEKILQAFAGITMVMINIGGTDWCSVTPLNAVQSRILGLLGFSTTIYQELGIPPSEVVFKMGEL